MNKAMRWRLVLLAVLAVVFCGIRITAPNTPVTDQGEACLGVPILTEAEAAQLGSCKNRDYSEDLKFRGEHIAVDKESSTVYISQNITEATGVQDLMGAISIDLPGHSLFFAPDDRWTDLAGAVRSGHPFRLLIAAGGTYTQYQVVFTTLPVLYLYGQPMYTNEDDRTVLMGELVLQDPQKLDHPLQTSYVQWHKRGGSASIMPKMPWKLSLKNKEGKNKNMNLLGMGSDDDWILNAMNREDSNIRELLFMDLWNALAAETDHNYPMSRGEYAEVLVNGEYAGLYLLQRRVDPKYLELEDSTILMKVNELDEGIEYEFVSSAYGKTIPYDLMDAFFYGEDSRGLDPENFVDVSLFLNFFSAKDNESYKNMFYVFDETSAGWRIRLIPWDTDMTMASFWGGAGVGFQYDYEKSLTYQAKRRELESMRLLHPQLDQKLCDRWFVLRETLLTEERITDLMDTYLRKLDESGAVLRDRETWGLYYEGQDTLENLYRFVKERLALLDEYYAQ